MLSLHRSNEGASMERVNAFSPGEDWEFLDCIHNVALTLNCPDCKEWRADDPPAGEIGPDGPEVVRVRSVSRETRPHSATCDLVTGRHYDNECTCGAEDQVSRETEPLHRQNGR